MYMWEEGGAWKKGNLDWEMNQPHNALATTFSHHTGVPHWQNSKKLDEH